MVLSAQINFKGFITRHVIQYDTQWLIFYTIEFYNKHSIKVYHTKQ